MKKRKSDLWEWLKIIVVAFILAGCIRYFLFTPIIVDGYSMRPTLENRDRMIVNRISYLIGEPKRFDIVVFHAPEKKDYIKRVIGLPGDHIEYKNDTLYINGKKYDEPYLDQYKKSIVGGTLTEPFSVTVPEGHIFVMGDNRRYSKDSRHIGPIPIDSVIGKANLIYWPLEDFRIIH
ncbi:MAG: signal peptidase I [Caldibacillus debilis]|uniref:Signal peptidase I n=1 Tax=Caldibacillus debilis TaxID=301148 RepID=A0A3E0K656_9BACI|nr:signal peptidase I [Caldibacillus debilis]REJ15314.1 MAG: signal peptidase I [Caldibacillus debilis]REJ29486.1 MAG: signal peptidase I [Caldibacillus debilis]